MWGLAWKLGLTPWLGFVPTQDASAPFIVRTGRRTRPRATKFCSERAKPIGKESSAPRRTAAESNTISSNKRAAAFQHSRPRADAWRHSVRHTKRRRSFIQPKILEVLSSPSIGLPLPITVFRKLSSDQLSVQPVERG